MNDKIDVSIDVGDVLAELSIGQILDYFDDDDGFLERIGIEKAKGYWGLRE